MFLYDKPKGENDISQLCTVIQGKMFGSSIPAIKA